MAEVALAYAKIGNPQQAETFIHRSRAQDKDNVNIVYAEAQISALLGKPTQAFTSLQEALEKHYPAEFAAVDPDLESLHGNIEFQSLIRKYSTKKP
jgi:predicted Zn-dependent protease